jgi:thioredoxin 1
MKGNFNKLVNSGVPVLIDFYAEWCGPCKAQAPILKEVAREVGNSAKLIKIDVDKNQELASRFGIKGVPTLLLFNKGQVVWKTSGVVSRDQLVKQIQNLIV